MHNLTNSKILTCWLNSGGKPPEDVTKMTSFLMLAFGCVLEGLGAFG
jgi:hypothetical protein